MLSEPPACLPPLFCLFAALCLPHSAAATPGNVFARGVIFHAATYINHLKYGTHPSYYGNPPEQIADINLDGEDKGTPLFAPEDGDVTIVHQNTDGWGYSAEWQNHAGTERLFLAHLQSIPRTGAVKAGEQIGAIGGTGGWSPHLHIESASGWVVLSGRALQPLINPPDNGLLYVSNGPLSDQESELHLPPASLIKISQVIFANEQQKCKNASAATTAASQEKNNNRTAVLPIFWQKMGSQMKTTPARVR